MEVTEHIETTTSKKTTTQQPIANASQAQIAQKTWEISNFIQEINSMDELFKYDFK